MNVTQLIEKIAGRQKERQQQKVQSYRDLVRQIASGKEPNPESVEATLEAAGKSLDDLQKAVKLYEQRMTWKAQVAMQQSLEKEQQRLQKEVAAADKALEDAESLHNEVTAPLYGELHQIKEGLSDASRARQLLFDSCDNEELWGHLRELSQESQRLMDENRDLQGRIAYFETRAQNRSLEIDRETNPVTRKSREEQVNSLLKEAEEVRQKIRANGRACADLTKRSEQIEQQMREW
jgi:TATA-binding protein-associated factor Taf7